MRISSYDSPSIFASEHTQPYLGARLEQVAREWLYQAYVTIPRRRIIRNLVRSVIRSVGVQDHQNCHRYMSQIRIQEFLSKVLAHRPGGAMTYLEWLRRPPRRRSLKTLRELFEKYQWLEERIGHGLPIPIPKERQHVYARRMRRRRAAHVTRLHRNANLLCKW